VHGPVHDVVPAFTGPSLDNPGFGGLADQLFAPDFDLEHHRLDVAGDHDVAAAAQHELGRIPQRRIGQHIGDVLLAVDAHQVQGLGHDAKGVGKLEGDVFLD
jgi:hypothetical protein